MARLKSSYTLQQKADEFDVYDLIDKIEEDIIKEQDRGYGEWEKYVCVLPNFQEVRQTLSNIKPIVNGRCWLVYDFEEMKRKQETDLDDDYFFIDYTFELLYQKNPSFKTIVDNNPYTNQHIFDCRLNDTYHGQFENEWADTHVFKLNRRTNIETSKMNSIYNYIVNH